MNMLLHGVENPDIRYKDSLAQTDDDDAEKYSLILANPPFAGSLDYESTAKDLQQIIKTKKTELLFGALFLRLLQTGGRAADHRARRRALRIKQGPQDPAQDPGRRAETRRHHLDALGRLQALRRGLDRHPALHQDQLRRHRRRLVLRHAGRRLFA